jgi:hypothetical protein
MKRHFALAVGVVAVSWTTASFAQDTTVQGTTMVQPPAPQMVYVAPRPVAESTTYYIAPNAYMIGTGIFVFAGAYIPAVAVAASSSVNADHHLYIPIVGPWIDIANRPACGPGSISCDNETTNKVLLGISGVFQGLGALTAIGGFFVPQRHTVITTAKADKPPNKPTIHFTPGQMGSGYGALAFGSF